MAYTLGFQNDIFISYAHVDNLVPSPGGWVDQFRASLERKLGQLIRRPGAIKIWCDSNVRPGRIFDEARGRVLKNSALFIAVTSRDYLESDYCRQELRWFARETANDAASLLLGDKARIFNVIISEVPRAWTPEFGSRHSYNLSDEATGTPRPVSDQIFERTLTALAEDLLENLNTLSNNVRNHRLESTKSEPLKHKARPDLPATGDLVFLSYSRDDEEFSLRLARSIKQLGIKIWVDQWDIPASADWERSIDDALAKCDRFLIVLSPASVNSEEVRSELRWALDQKKPVVPVLYQKCTIPRRLLLTQYVDFGSTDTDDEGKLMEVVDALRSASDAAE